MFYLHYIYIMRAHISFFSTSRIPSTSCSDRRHSRRDPGRLAVHRHGLRTVRRRGQGDRRLYRLAARRRCLLSCSGLVQQIFFVPLLPVGECVVFIDPLPPLDSASICCSRVVAWFWDWSLECRRLRNVQDTGEKSNTGEEIAFFTNGKLSYRTVCVFLYTCQHNKGCLYFNRIRIQPNVQIRPKFRLLPDPEPQHCKCHRKTFLNNELFRYIRTMHEITEVNITLL
jgi:hypothetical protein